LRELAFIASELVGSPFRYKAEGPGSFDCYGLLKFIYRMFAIHLPDFDYPEKWLDKNHNFISEGLLKMNWQQRAKDKIQPLDALVFLINQKPGHLGLALDDQRFLHSVYNRGVLISELKRWQTRLHSVWIPNGT